MSTRIEKDSLGEITLPAAAYYGPQTARAIKNFPISHRTFPSNFINAYGMIKEAYAQFNSFEDNELSAEIKKAIIQAAKEVQAGNFNSDFLIDIFQTGSGTSTNMNLNEVISRRATEIMHGTPTGKPAVHPNDQVNKGQSSNDTFPAAMHISTVIATKNSLLPAIKELAVALKNKSNEFTKVIKIGRTHLQDATPITLGQEFSGYSQQMLKSIIRLEKALEDLYELPLGGTAVGTGLNSSPKVVKQAITFIADKTGFPFREAANHFEAQASKDGIAQFHATLKTLAISLTKIANDIRWLSSGPRCGLGEIDLPATQPGSSIMPGKINPVQAESLLMVAAKVIGNDATITLGAQAGNFELNVMMPVMADCTLESIKLLTNSINIFKEKAISGIKANKERCLALTEISLSLVTNLVPVIGYDKAAEIAHQSLETGKSIRELLLAEGKLSAEEINSLLDPSKMTHAE